MYASFLSSPAALIDPQSEQATYRDGLLHESVQRRAAAEPQRIQVQ